jgi:hypothetical protein
MNNKKGDGKGMNSQYDVLSPWAEVDPILFRGLMVPRLTDLEGKKIGLFASSKPISKRIMTVVEGKLKERFPNIETSWYVGEGSWAVLQMETQNRKKYQEWLNGVDAVVAAVGD